MVQKHFYYTGEVHASSVRQVTPEDQDIKFLDVKFLVPAKIDMVVKGSKITSLVNVDLANKQVYEKNSRWSTLNEQKFFEYLENRNSLPEDMFEADENITDDFSSAQAEHDRMTKENNV